MSGYAEWNSVTAYATNDIVTYNGVIYIALQNSLNQVPPGSPAYWSASGGTTAGVSSLNALTGAVSVASLTPSTLTVGTSGNTIQLSATPAPAAGVSELNGLAGGLQIVSTTIGLNVTPNVGTNSIELSYTGGGGGGGVSSVQAGYNISVDNTNPTAPVVGLIPNNSIIGGNIAVLTDNQNPLTPAYYYGLQPYELAGPSFLTFDPANNGTPANQWRVGGMTDVNVLASPQSGAPDLQVDIVFTNQASLGRLFQMIPGLDARIINNNSLGNNDMFVRIVYEPPSGGGPQVPVGTVQISPEDFVDIRAITPTATHSNGTPFSFVYVKYSGGGTITRGIY